MAMAAPRLLRGLIAPLPLSPANWLPCHQQLLTSAALLHRCSDGFKLFLVPLRRLRVHGAHPPPRRPRRRRKGELHVPAAVFFRNFGINKDVVFIKRVIATPGDFIEVRQGHASYTMEAMVHRYLCMTIATTQTNDYTYYYCYCKRRTKSGMAAPCCVVDFLSTPIPLFFRNEMK